MNISVRWIKQLIDFDLSVKDLMHGLTMSGLEVENELNLGYEDQMIVIGKILERNPHPDADKLSCCKVDVGSEVLDIVCGADNMKAGDKVVVARNGSKLPNGMKLKSTKIRGVVSNGMMCSESELGLAKTSSGIMILDELFPVGEGFDFVFEVAITPNRPDCLSMLGIAREIKALCSGVIKHPKSKVSERLESALYHVNLTIKAKDLCPRYTARVIGQVKIGPSPIWMQNFLAVAGIRPINNIVDITNYVLLELGQPLHAFDYDLIKDKKITVRKAKKGESILAIDEKSYMLEDEDLVIADSSRPIAIAGVIGGKNTEVTQDTVNVVLESAYFNPSSVRRTSKRLGLSTDASYRFERGADYDGLYLALNRAAGLIQDIAQGEVTKGIYEVNALAKDLNHTVSLSYNNVNRVLGTNMDISEISEIATRLQFEVVNCSKQEVLLSIPSYRVDLEREIDLIEEIARVYGYNKIPETFPKIDKLAIAKINSSDAKLKKLRAVLNSSGLSETIHYSFVADAYQADLGFDSEKFIALQNPLSRELNVLRISLFTSILKALQLNDAQGMSDVAFFEIGKIFQKTEKKMIEENSMAILLSGKNTDGWLGSSDWDFYSMKGIVEEVMDFFGVKSYQIEYAKDNPLLHPGKAMIVKQGRNVFFEGGQLHPVMKKKLGLTKDCFIGVFALESLLARKSKLKKYSELFRFPGMNRDISMIFDRSVSFVDLQKAIQKTGGNLLQDIRLTDVYEHDSLGDNMRSLTFNLLYRHPDRTLTDEEVKPLFEKAISYLQSEFGGNLR